MLYRKINKSAYRIAAGLLTVSLLAPSLSALATEAEGEDTEQTITDEVADNIAGALPGVDITTTGWVLASGIAGALSRTRSDAYAWVTGAINRTAPIALQNLDATTNLDMSSILSDYGVYLVYMDWVCNNVSQRSETERWTVFQSPADQDTASVSDLIDLGEEVRSKIVEKGNIPSTTDTETLAFASSSAFSSPLPSSMDLLTGEMAGIQDYYNAAVGILDTYVDGHVLVALATYFDITTASSEASSIATSLATDFPYEWYESILEGDAAPEMITVANAVKDDILPYLDVYNEILAAYKTASSGVLKDETFTAGGEDYAVLGYTYARGNSSIEDTVSYITRALYTYIFSASTGESTDNQIALDEDMDLSGGALGLMANAKITSNYTIEPTTGLNLTELGYHVLAAGVTYIPFVSKAGDEIYLATLESFLQSSDKMSDAISVLQSAINTKKPLYVTDGKNDSWMEMDELEAIPFADWRYAMLSDMLQIQQNVTRAYAVVKGQMGTSEVDASTWDYVVGTGTVSTSSSSAQVDTTDEEQDSTATNNVRISGTMSITSASEELTASGEQMSNIIALTAGKETAVTTYASHSYMTALGGLTSLILHNASLNVKGNEKIANAETEMLFLNGLGDIVLADGTVVLPAIANPILYEYPIDGEVGGILAVETGDVESGEVEDAPETGYYPYTATFMNSYPSISVNPDKVAIVSSADVERYVVTSYNGSRQAVRIYQVKDSGQMSVALTDRVTLPYINGYAFSVQDDATVVQNLLPWAQASAGNWRYHLAAVVSGSVSNGITGGINIGGILGGIGSFTSPPEFMAVYQALNDQRTFFPLVEDNPDVRDSYLSVAVPLVTSAVRYVSSSSQISSSDTTIDAAYSSSGAFRIESYIVDFMAQGMLGTSYASTLVKSLQLDYESLVDDQYNRLTRLVSDVVSSWIEDLGNIDGVLAIKDGYENSFFNMIMNFLQDSYILIVVILLVLLAVKFLRGRLSAPYLLLIGAVTFAAFQVYAVWMPTAVPAAYNFFVNDAVEDIVWNTVTVSAERYEETYGDSDRKDSQTGAPRPYTATITLYKLTQAEMEQVSAQTNTPIEDISSGEIVYLDEEGGIFLQGDAIKQSIDRLFVNNTLRGLYESQWDLVDSNVEEIEPVTDSTSDNPYIVKLTNSYVSLESYYTPFAQIERAFIGNLNTFADIFVVSRNYFAYSDGLYKDAFLFNSFTNSGIFTAPGDDATLAANVRSDQITGSMTATVEDIITRCNQYFYPQEDWLNLRSVFLEPAPAMQDSLWGQMLLRQGYYNDDWSTTPEQEEKIWDLILYINNQTKYFVLQSQDRLNFCSDENAIKLVSLYATTCFTHRVSQFGYWLYPNYINASGIELSDVLYGALTSLEDRVTASNGTVTNTVMLNVGLPGLLMLFIITLASVVFIFILTYMVPVLYVMFGVLLVWKLVNTEENTGLVKGYFKVTGVTIVLYLGYSLGLRLVNVGGYQWYGYLATTITSVLCVYFLLAVIMAIVRNPLELGNGYIGANLFGAVDRLTGGRLGNLVANNFRVQAPQIFSHSGMQARAYRRAAPLDAIGGMRRPRRGEHYGRWDDFDDSNLSARARVISRFGRLATEASEVGQTRTGFRQSRIMRSARSARRAVTNIRNGVSHFGDRFRNFGQRQSAD